jgi:hypothetical protein
MQSREASTGSPRVRWLLRVRSGQRPNCHREVGTRLVSASSNTYTFCSSQGVTLDHTDAVTQLTEQIIGAAIDVHGYLGPGLLESTCCYLAPR